MQLLVKGEYVLNFPLPSCYGNAWNDYHKTVKKGLCFIMNLKNFSFFHTCTELKVKWP